MTDVQFYTLVAFHVASILTNAGLFLWLAWRADREAVTRRAPRGNG